MARSDYGPEIRGAMSGHAGEVEKPSTPTGRTRVNTKPSMRMSKPSAENSPDSNQRGAQAQATDKVVTGRMAGTTNTDNQSAMQHAAGIAHAILGGRRMV